MKAFELCSEDHSNGFTVGKGNVVWESASYRDGCDMVYISRVVESSEPGGKPFMMGLRYKFRYIDPNTRVYLIEKNTN